MISFIGRQWFRTTQGANLVGLPMNAILWLAAQYGIYSAFFHEIAIPFWIFLPVGVVVWGAMYWGAGFLGDTLGLFKQVQSHMNRENNIEWVDAYEKIKKIAEKMEVK